jgi:Ca2+-binding EF-hand superfamily protein
MEKALEILDTNQNGKIDVKEIFDYIVEKMKAVNKIKNMSGKQKKYRVMSDIEILFGSDILESFKEMIGEFIDFYYRKFMKKCSKIYCC